MKPKYIFSAVFAVSTLLAVLLPGIGAHRVKTVDAYAAPAAVAALPTAVVITQPIAAVQQPTLAPIQPGGQAPAAVLPSPTAAKAAAASSPVAEATAAPILPPPSAPAQPAVNASARIPKTALPGLPAFIDSFRNAPAGQAAGAYIEGLFALPIVQQPADNPDFVSPDDNTLTQFVKPVRFDVIGLLAHNYLSGRSFAQLQRGQEIVIVYGGGQAARFRVTRFQHYQAVDSADDNTDYIDLDHAQNAVLSQQQVFDLAYTNGGQLVLQTCIEKNGDYSWGRLFIIAEPE